MGKKLLPYLIGLSALAVSASAAFYSVSGLMKLFAGASLAVGIMAGSLEVSKLVIASLLYQYWDSINKLLRTYLTIAAFILILITSAGIYGFLTSAYQETVNKEQITAQQVSALETKKKLFEQSRDNLLKEKQNLSELRGSLAKSTTTQYTDNKGNLVVRSNNASFNQIDKTAQVDEKLTQKVEAVNDSIFKVETKILQVKTTATQTSELGPLKYLSGLTGVEMNVVINWFLMVIIFVFDPLAIALVIAANFAFTRASKTITKQEQKQHLVDIMKADQETGLYEKEELKKTNSVDLQEEVPGESETELEPKEVPSQVETEIQNIQNSPHFSEWKKKQLIAERLKQARIDENSITYWK